MNYKLRKRGTRKGARSRSKVSFFLVTMLIPAIGAGIGGSIAKAEEEIPPPALAPSLSNEWLPREENREEETQGNGRKESKEETLSQQDGGEDRENLSPAVAPMKDIQAPVEEKRRQQKRGIGGKSSIMAKASPSTPVTSVINRLGKENAQGWKLSSLQHMNKPLMSVHRTGSSPEEIGRAGAVIGGGSSSLMQNWERSEGSGGAGNEHPEGVFVPAEDSSLKTRKATREGEAEDSSASTSLSSAREEAAEVAVPLSKMLPSLQRSRGSAGKERPGFVSSLGEEPSSAYRKAGNSQGREEQRTQDSVDRPKTSRQGSHYGDDEEGDARKQLENTGNQGSDDSGDEGERDHPRVLVGDTEGEDVAQLRAQNRAKVGELQNRLFMHYASMYEVEVESRGKEQTLARISENPLTEVKSLEGQLALLHTILSDRNKPATYGELQCITKSLHEIEHRLPPPVKLSLVSHPARRRFPSHQIYEELLRVRKYADDEGVLREPLQKLGVPFRLGEQEQDQRSLQEISLLLIEDLRGIASREQQREGGQGRQGGEQDIAAIAHYKQWLSIYKKKLWDRKFVWESATGSMAEEEGFLSLDDRIAEDLATIQDMLPLLIERMKGGPTHASVPYVQEWIDTMADFIAARAKDGHSEASSEFISSLRQQTIDVAPLLLPLDQALESISQSWETITSPHEQQRLAGELRNVRYTMQEMAYVGEELLENRKFAYPSLIQSNENNPPEKSRIPFYRVTGEQGEKVLGTFEQLVGSSERFFVPDGWIRPIKPNENGEEIMVNPHTNVFSRLYDDGELWNHAQPGLPPTTRYLRELHLLWEVDRKGTATEVVVAYNGGRPYALQKGQTGPRTYLAKNQERLPLLRKDGQHYIEEDGRRVAVRVAKLRGHGGKFAIPVDSIRTIQYDAQQRRTVALGPAGRTATLHFHDEVLGRGGNIPPTSQYALQRYPVWHLTTGEGAVFLPGRAPYLLLPQEEEGFHVQGSDHVRRRIEARDRSEYVVGLVEDRPTEKTYLIPVKLAATSTPNEEKGEFLAIQERVFSIWRGRAVGQQEVGEFVTVGGKEYELARLEGLEESKRNSLPKSPPGVPSPERVIHYAGRHVPARNIQDHQGRVRWVALDLPSPTGTSAVFSVGGTSYEPNFGRYVMGTGGIPFYVLKEV